MPHKVGIGRRKAIKNMKRTLTDTSRPSSPLSGVCSNRKAVHEKKPKYKLPAASSFNSLIINYDLNMGEKSCGDCSMDKHTLSQHDFDYNNVDVSSGFYF